jgi:MarR family transcriptional regulator, organic hydroperoxide resistance regulator
VASSSRKFKVTGNPQAIPVEAEVYLTLQHVADLLVRPVEELLKASGLSGTQYNVLRILRGAERGKKSSGGGESNFGDGADFGGLPCGEIAARMITRDPDITRLLDRLEAHGLVERSRQKKDRRVVLARITPAGIELLKKLDKPIETMHRAQLAHVPAASLRQLLAHLKEIRSAVTQIKACAGTEEEKSHANTH